MPSSGARREDTSGHRKLSIDVLRSDLIRGYVLHYIKGTASHPIRVVDAEGGYVRREPLIDDELWYKAQAALDACTKKLSGVRAMGSMLIQIAFCGYCGGPLHRIPRANGRTGRCTITTTARNASRPLRFAGRYSTR